jgi:type I restriction enzyme, S subunit
MNWHKKTLGEIYEVEGGSIQTGPFGSQLHESDYKPEGIPVIMPKDIVEDKIDLSSIAFISKEDGKRLSQHIVFVDDIVFPRRGDINKRVLIDETTAGAFCGTGCIRLRGGDNSLLLPKFLFFYLKQQHIVSWIENQAIGATMMNLNTSILKSVPILLPSLQIQQLIASILSTYDDLIENNKKRIKLLEEMAEEIYKEWFVRFRFPGYDSTRFLDEKGKEVPHGTPGALPEGWENSKLGNILAAVQRKPKISSDKYQTVGTFPIIDQGDLLIAGYTNDDSYVQFEPLPLLVFGDHTRRVKFVNTPFASGADGTQLLYPKNKNLSPIYFYIAVKNIDLSNFHYARHFKFLKQEQILVPDNVTLKKFNDLTRRFFGQIDLLRSQNQLLQQTRDLLLPRLISGNLSVEHLLERNLEPLSLAAEPEPIYSK